jgi:hypothetical protein
MSNELEFDQPTRDLIERGEKAADVITRARSWGTWVELGRALEAAQIAIMRATHSNVPNGRRFNERFSLWLGSTRHIKEIDKGDRSRLMRCMDNLAAITTWRESLSKDEQHKLNHPTTVWRRWEKEFGEKKKAAANRPRPNLLEENVALQDEITHLKAKLKRAEDAEDEFMANDPKELAGIFWRRNPTKASKLWAALGALQLNAKNRKNGKPNERRTETA